MITIKLQYALQALATWDSTFFDIYEAVVSLSQKENYDVEILGSVAESLYNSGIIRDSILPCVYEVAAGLDEISLYAVVEAVEGKVEIPEAVLSTWSLPETPEEAMREVTVKDLMVAGILIDGYKYDPERELVFGRDVVIEREFTGNPEVDDETLRMLRATILKIRSYEASLPARIARVERLMGAFMVGIKV